MKYLREKRDVSMKLHGFFEENTSAGLLLAIILAGGFLRIYHLGTASLWMDEIGQVVVASQGWWELFQRVRMHVSPPLDYLVTKIALLFGNSDGSVRLPAAIFGIASLPLMFLFARKFVSEKAALLATALLALSPMAISYSQEARMYSLYLFLSLVSFLLTWECLEKKSLKIFAAWGFVNGLLLLTHYFGFLVAGAETCLLGIALWRTGGRRQGLFLLFLGWGISLALFSPWFPYFIWQAHYHRGEIWYALEPDWDFFKNIFNAFICFGGGKEAGFHTILFLFLFLAGCFEAFIEKNHKLMVLCLSFFGILLALFALSYFKKIVTPRNLMALLPLYLLPAGAGICFLLKNPRITSIRLGLAITGLLMAWPVYYLLSQPSLKPDWKNAAQYIQAHSLPGDRTLTIDNFNRGCLAYYLDPGAQNVYSQKAWTEMQNRPIWKTWNADCLAPEDIAGGKVKGWFVFPPTYFAGPNMNWRRQKARYGLKKPICVFNTQLRPLEIYRLD
jgi:4-amino-4-deoxy-L-arabinose transferase-like glycosyltransferase